MLILETRVAICCRNMCSADGIRSLSDYGKSLKWSIRFTSISRLFFCASSYGRASRCGLKPMEHAKGEVQREMLSELFEKVERNNKQAERRRKKHCKVFSCLISLSFWISLRLLYSSSSRLFAFVDIEDGYVRFATGNPFEVRKALTDSLTRLLRSPRKRFISLLAC